MNGQAARAEFGVRIERDFVASRDRVYQAWTEPEKFKRWFRPPGCMTESAEFELHPGGRFQILLLNEASGVRFPILGVFRIVQPSRRLRFTWGFADPGGPSCETLVTVDFLDLGQATRVSLRHEYLPGPEAVRSQEEALAKCLDQLAHYLAI